MRSKSWILLIPVLVFLLLMHAPNSLGNCYGKTLIKTGVSCAQKLEILHEHNRLRQLVALGHIRPQPPAKYMMEMVWDDELAAVAQRWAGRCNEYHDKSRHVRRFPVGQNIALTWTQKVGSTVASYDTQPDWKKIVNKWFEEVSSYYYQGQLNSNTNHYTQIVWAQTQFVGCGFSYYYDARKGYIKNYVCNYGPRGNVQLYKPYPAGSPNCNAYGIKFSEYYSGLCSRQDNGFPLGAYCTLRF